MKVSFTALAGKKYPFLLRFKKKNAGLAILFIGLLVCFFFLYPLKSDLLISDAFVEGNSITVSAANSGVMVKRYVAEGEFVKKGQLLLELDDRKFQADLRYAEAQIQHAKDELSLYRIQQEKVMLDYLSGRQKFEGQEISQEDLDRYVKGLEEAQALCNMAASKIEILEARLVIYRLKSESSKIYAPCDGVITKQYQIIGDFVRKGQEIFALYDLSNLWVQAHVNESKLHCFKLEDTAKISISSYPDLDFSGKVFSISPSISYGENTKSRLVPVRISIHQNNGDSKVPLRPGMLVSVDLSHK